MDMQMFDIFWYIGIAVCVVYAFIYAKDAITLSGMKKKCAMVKGKARTCTMDRKWAYTAVNIKYDFKADGEVIKGQRSVKSVFRPSIYPGSEIEIYYEKDNVHSGFLGEEIKSDVKNIIILVILGVVLAVTVLV